MGTTPSPIYLSKRGRPVPQFSHPSLPVEHTLVVIVSISLSRFSRCILWPRWVARIGVTRSTQAFFLTADRPQTTVHAARKLPLLRLPRLSSREYLLIRNHDSHRSVASMNGGSIRRRVHTTPATWRLQRGHAHSIGIAGDTT